MLVVAAHPVTSVYPAAERATTAGSGVAADEIPRQQDVDRNSRTRERQLGIPVKEGAIPAVAQSNRAPTTQRTAAARPKPRGVRVAPAWRAEEPMMILVATFVNERQADTRSAERGDP